MKEKYNLRNRIQGIEHSEFNSQDLRRSAEEELL